MSASDADEFDRDEEYDEQEEDLDRGSYHDEEEEDEEGGAEKNAAAVIDERFVEHIPEKKPVPTVLSLRLPKNLRALAAAAQRGSDDEDNENDAEEDAASSTTDVEVEVRLTRPTYGFETVCRAALHDMRTANVMRQLAQDVEGLRAFVAAENARQHARAEDGLTLDDELSQNISPDALDEMALMLEKIHRAGAGLATRVRQNGDSAGAGEDGEDDEVAAAAENAAELLAGEDEAEDGEDKAPLYWLAPLLANDAPTLERTLAGMYGWAIPPPSPPRPPRAVSFAAAGGGGAAAGRQRGASSTSHPDTSPSADDEEDEEAAVPDPARARPSWFKSSGAFGGVEGSHLGSADEDEENDSEAVDGDRQPREHSPDVLEGNASAATTTEKEGEADTGVKVLGEGSARLSGVRGSRLASSVHAPPLMSVPAFGDVNRRLWIVMDTATDAWHLLDEHPLLRTLRCRTEKALETANAAREDGAGGGAEVDEEGEDEERVAGGKMNANDDEDEEDEDDASDGSRRGQARVPAYNLDTMLAVDAVVLSALCCPAALRLALLQRRRPSLSCVEHWLRQDLATGFPILATVHAAIVASYAVDGPRLPYTLPSLRLDFNIFFEEPFLTGASSPSSVTRPMMLSVVSLAGSPYAKHLLCQERQVSLISSSLSHAARVNMEMLLAAGVFPSRPVRQAVFESTEGVRLALWLLMAIPRATLVRWGFPDTAARAARERAGATEDGTGADHSARAAAEEADWYPPVSPGQSAANGNGEDDEDNGDEDGDGSVPPGDDEEDETIDGVCERIARQRRRTARVARTAEGPLLRLAPLVMEVLLEVRRRIAREMKTKPPSHLPLLTSLERVYKLSQVEDGTPRGDPLLTTRFLLALPVPVVSPSREDADVVMDAARPADAPLAEGDVARAACFRHQRLYQSDLVLLLLALTSTPQPRGVVTAHAPAPTALQKKPPPPPPSLRRDAPHHALDDTALAASGHSAALAAGKPVAAPVHASFSLAEPAAAATAVSLRRRSLLLLQGTPSDAHEALFTALIEAKLGRATTTPMALLRSGTCRLLLRALPRFRHQHLMQVFCQAVPLYQVLGESETAPLPSLVAAWSAELSKALTLELVTGMVQHRYLDAFTNQFWHELHCRLAGGLYDAARVRVMRRQLTVLFDKVDERLRRYQEAMAALGGVIHVDHALYRSNPTAAASMGLSASNLNNGTGGVGGASGRRLTARSTSVMSTSHSLIGAPPTSDFHAPPSARFSMAAAARGPKATANAAAPRSSTRLAGGANASAPGQRWSLLSLSASGEGMAAGAGGGAGRVQAAESAPALPRAPVPRAAAAASGRSTGRQLGLYDVEFKRELTRVRALLNSLPMVPGTYLTPYTLFALLFGDTEEDVKGTSTRGIDLAAVYYVVVVHGITTVRTDPFLGADMPALEYAVRELNLPAARTLVQLGASLEELIEGGTMTIEQYCELMFAPAEVEELRQLADLHTHYTTTNPDAHYGILRNMRSAAVGV